MAKNVMITNELFVMLVKHHVFGFEGYEDGIRKALNEKMDAMNRRILYSKSKTAATKEERERSRQEYLDTVGMKESYRWRNDSVIHH